MVLDRVEYADVSRFFSVPCSETDVAQRRRGVVPPDHGHERRRKKFDRRVLATVYCTDRSSMSLCGLSVFSYDVLFLDVSGRRRRGGVAAPFAVVPRTVRRDRREEARFVHGRGGGIDRGWKGWEWGRQGWIGWIGWGGQRRGKESVDRRSLCPDGGLARGHGGGTVAATVEVL